MNATATVERILDYDVRINAYAEIMKVIHDGQHFVATPLQKAPAISRVRHQKDGSDLAFETAYFAAMRANPGWGKLKREARHAKLIQWISDYMVEQLSDVWGGDLNWVADQIIRHERNKYLREKRFRNKAHLNPWNYFVTFTYDEEKMDAETFRASIRKCLSNLHTRRGWKYIGVFELGDEGERLHFHALVYIPEGQMPGKLHTVRRYSTKRHRWEEALENTFFADHFGINEFDPILNRKGIKGAVDYIIKYIFKSGERAIYSRAVPTELVTMVQDEQIAAEMLDFFGKFVLFDDAFVLWSEDKEEPEVIRTE